MASEHIRQQTVVAQVMEQIRSLIASGAYKPGDRMPTEKELAERFGIGRSSIREAIKIFNYLGVLESRAALGTFVRARSDISAEALSWSLLLGDDDVEDLIDLRGSIELWSLLAFVRSVGRKEPLAIQTLGALDAIVEGMETAVRENRRDDLIESDFQFHYAIIRSSSNALFCSLYETLRSFLHGEIKRSQDDYEDPAQICEEHRSLLRAFKTGDTLVAAEAFDEHIENIKQRLRGAAESADALSGRAHGRQKADALDGTRDADAVDGTHDADALNGARGGESRTPGSGAE